MAILRLNSKILSVLPSPVELWPCFISTLMILTLFMLGGGASLSILNTFKSEDKKPKGVYQTSFWTGLLFALFIYVLGYNPHPSLNIDTTHQATLEAWLKKTLIPTPAVIEEIPELAFYGSYRGNIDLTPPQSNNPLSYASGVYRMVLKGHYGDLSAEFQHLLLDESMVLEVTFYEAENQLIFKNLGRADVIDDKGQITIMSTKENSYKFKFAKYVSP